MRTQFIPNSGTPYSAGQATADNLDEAKDIAPWAAEIAAVEGGFMAFESVVEYRTWQAQG